MDAKELSVFEEIVEEKTNGEESSESYCVDRPGYKEGRREGIAGDNIQ